MFYCDNYFAVRFHRKDGKAHEEYCYSRKEDAVYHFNLFHDDDFGLYTHIDLIEINPGSPEVVLDIVRF